MIVVVINTGQTRAVRRRVPLTQKHGAQRPAEEPLTFFPDAQCCPPSAAVARAATTGAVAGGSARAVMTTRTVAAARGC